MAPNTQQVMYLLHELVLTDLVNRVQSADVSIKDIQTAVQFLKNNDVRMDLSGRNEREAARAQLAIIPRLSPEELELG